MSAVITAGRPDTTDASALVEEPEGYLATIYPSESRHGYSVEKLISEGVSFFVLRDNGRRAGFGKLLLDHLTGFARSRGVGLLRLETGIHQHAAIKLYEREGFTSIPRFGAYRDAPLSRFFEKRII